MRSRRRLLGLPIPAVDFYGPSASAVILADRESEDFRFEGVSEALALSEPGAPVDIRATLPGLVVAVSVEEGDQVEAGAALLTIEAMKMQNEVRAPRGGRIAALAVTPGQPVATGVLLLRIE